MSNKPVLVVNRLSREYDQGGNAEPLLILQDLSLSVNRGEKLAIVGVSGSGKTSLLNLLGGLDDPSDGSVIVCGENWADLGPSERASWRNQHLGFVYQFHHLLGEFSALENVALPLLIGGESVVESKRLAADLLSRVGLGERLNHQPAQLSGGERQRVAIARALVTQPSVVLMDEPTGNLDPYTAAAVLDLLAELNEVLGICFVVVSHDSSIAARMDRTVCLLEGKLTEQTLDHGHV